jgi:hypothetical protein
VPRLQEEVIRAWEATVSAEAARAEVVHAVTAYVQEAATAQEIAEASIKEAKAHVTIVEREAREWMLKTEAESTTSLAFVHVEASELAQMVTFLEGEVEDVRQSHDTFFLPRALRCRL